jgi:hypothetical protein
MGKEKGWIGVDLDGTLAQYDEWNGPEHIGEPIPTMVDRVKMWISKGEDVRIFTSRVSQAASDDSGYSIEQIRLIIVNWCLRNLGVILAVTNEKDIYMKELWDDLPLYQVERNTGKVIS